MAHNPRYCLHWGRIIPKRTNPECLGEIFRLLHFSYEAGYGNLPDKRVADVQERVHATNEASTCGWNDRDDWIPRQQARLATARSVETCWMCLNSSENCRQDDGNEREERREGRNFG